jgi:exopolyphosphatase / guanosine-5'-triphosphate,3'-diphosphate pyrophosphatase
VSLVRVPIRLGSDVFLNGNISSENRERMVKALSAYKLLMEVHKVQKFKACATSAMREALNGQDVATYVSKKSGVNIDIIDGKTEASIIASTDLKQYIDKDKNYLYVDVGGGSAEFSLFKNGAISQSKSFPIGTVRQIGNVVDKQIWLSVENWIKTHTKDLQRLNLIGSGGNINKIYKMSGKKIGRPMSYLYLNSQYHLYSQMSYEERISKLELNPDRADVIIPALKVYLLAMKWSKARNIYVPKIGLADGIIKSLYTGVLK